LVRIAKGLFAYT